MRWSIVAAPLLLALPAGCLAHERPAAEVDAGGLPSDSSLLVLDAGPPSLPDAAPVLDGGPPVACALDETSVTVRVEPVTAEVARCAFTHAEGAYLTAIEAAPLDDGLRFHFDLCPAADADCRCDVVVGHVGTDIAASLGPDSNVTIDVAPGDGFFPGAMLAITKIPTCECNGCGCSEPLYFYAATTPAAGAQHVPVPLAFSQGAAVCAPLDCTFGGSWMLHAVSDGGEADVPGGTQRDLGAVHVRSIRDIEVFAPCAACAACGTPIGAFVAWVDS